MDNKEIKVAAYIKAYGIYSKANHWYFLSLLTSNPEISWTIWDDNIDERTDENGETVYVTYLYYDKDGVTVELNTGKRMKFSAIDFDDNGSNFADYILERLDETLEIPFDSEELKPKEDFTVMTICREDLRDSGIKNWKNVSDEDMDYIAYKLCEYLEDGGDWRDDLVDACERCEIY